MIILYHCQYSQELSKFSQQFFLDQIEMFQVFRKHQIEYETTKSAAY